MTNKLQKSKQALKYHMSIAGEYFVAAELQRRGFHASITLGNAKRVDVVTFTETGDRAVKIEVKTTAQPKWVVGGFVPEAGEKPWVFVFLASPHTAAPCFYVLTQSKLSEILGKNQRNYLKKFKARNGKEFSGRGVVKLSRSSILEYEGRWETITNLLN